jgi:alkylation response protein AidB-like acyl-CoA dehydrogenase
MYLAWSDTDMVFRDEVRESLAEAPEKLTSELRAAGRLMNSVYAEHEANTAWQAILHEPGWAAPAWPVDYGGCGWSLTRRQPERSHP